MSTKSRFSGARKDDNTFRVLSGDFQTPVYAALIAILVAQNSHKTIVQPAQLTGAVTFTANVDNGAGSVAPFVGDEIIFLLQSDGTSRVATFGSGFLPTGTLSVTTGKFASIKFIYNGTAWIELSRAVTA